MHSVDIPNVGSAWSLANLAELYHELGDAWPDCADVLTPEIRHSLQWGDRMHYDTAARIRLETRRTALFTMPVLAKFAAAEWTVLQPMLADTTPPVSTATIRRSRGTRVVTLTGTANWQYQRDEAEFVASNIVGTLDVVDEIELMYPTPDRGDVKESIKKAFKRNASLDADDLHVSTDNGSVTLKGTVSSWAEHDEAIGAAWAAPGVTSVQDDLTVAY